MNTMRYAFSNTLLFIVPVLIFTIGGLIGANKTYADHGGRGQLKQQDSHRQIVRADTRRSSGARSSSGMRKTPTVIRKERTKIPVIRKETHRTTIRRDVRVKTRPRIYYRPGYRVRVLPKNYRRIVVRDKIYFYYSGIFYWPSSTGYVVITSPIGAIVTYLPTGYISFYLGPRHYFYVNLTYFLWLPDTREYIVIEKPVGADNAIAEVSTTDLVIYPKRGQSDKQRDKDRYECHRWAVKESGYDPSLPANKTGSKDKYLRAMKACLEARGYIVK